MAKMTVKVEAEKVKEILTAAVEEAKLEVDNLIAEAVAREKNQMILDVLNGLEVKEYSFDIDEAYMLVENDEILHAKLNAVGVPSEFIDECNSLEGDLTCILTLAFSHGYANSVNDSLGLELLNQEQIELMLDDENRNVVAVEEKQPKGGSRFD